MERCPYCGQMSRAGARFCTVCGYRIVDDVGVSVVATSVNAEPTANVDGGETTALESGGWPAPPQADERAMETGWESGAATLNAGAAELAENEGYEEEEAASIWSPQSGSTWPGQQVAEMQAVSETAARRLENGIAVAGEPDDLPVEETTPGSEQIPGQQERAARLLDELRGIIASMGDANALDLGGVISELEVAVTPPGAIDVDNLSTLREALLAARERPRDLDTVVDLTGRIDAMVALVFAYERAIAAIERSLDVLRRQ